jgi:hypothetical protein
LSQAKGTWVLSIDADERVTLLLKDAINQAIKHSEIVGWEMPRMSSLCGKYIKHCGWWPDHVTRLFKNGHAKFSDDIVHEKLIVNGSIGTLKTPLMHESIESLDELLSKMNEYTSAGALCSQAK